MADREEGQEGHAPEDQAQHPLPSPTIWPLGFAAGIAVFLVGLGLTNWIIFGIGVALAVVFGALWIRAAVHEAHAPRVAAEELAPEPEQPEAEEVERFPRNKFLELSTLGLGAAIGVAVTVPVAAFLIGPSFTKTRNKDEEIDLGPLDNYPEGEWRVTTFRSKEREGDVSLRTAFVRYNGLADTGPSFTIISNRCAHLGCPTQPGGPTEEEAAREIETGAGTVRLIPAQPAGFVCPCHGGAYDIEGNRTAGPPVRALDRYSYSIIDGNLVLGTRFSVGRVEGTGKDATLTTFTRFDPGQHVDGWEQIFNPVSPHQIYSPNPNP